ncbi:MAG: hypothetical protein ACOVQR_10265 [Flavobacterium sp.]|jgi:hypothetical protein|uniref:hypothetical protein n=1 Tax=Flavobacterium sp. TaxID=239 RepID=UPI003BA5A4C1
MKRIFLLLMTVAFFSCEDESRIPTPDRVEGAFVFIDKTKPVIDVTQIATSTFEGVLNNPSGNVVKYDLYVRRVSGGVAGDYVLLESITSFPYNLSVSAGEVATVLGLQLSDILPGDRFDFWAETFDANNVKTTFNELSSFAQAEVGIKQAYQYNTYVSCPFIQADALGVYEFTEDAFANETDVFEVIAGSSEDKIIMVDPFGHPSAFNIEVVVDLGSGIASIQRQNAWDPSFYSLPANYGTATIATDGSASFFFSCTGTINFSVKHDVAIGTYGFRNFKAQKL